MQQERFGVSFSGEMPIEFIYLFSRELVEARRYPRFTMLGQSLGSMILAFEALWRASPDIFIDTTGFAFSYPVARALASSRVLAFVHYPTISTV